MKVSKEVSARHREALVTAAGRLLRDRGFDRTGVAEIAAAAGLTHGAFYSHFPSKEALCEEAVARMSSPLSDSGSWPALVNAYLDQRHVRDRAVGCPYAALAADVPREAAPIRAAFAKSLDRWVDTVAELMPGKPSRKRAIAAAAALLGAVTMARTATSTQARDEILESARRHLLGQDVAERSRRS